MKPYILSVAIVLFGFSYLSAQDISGCKTPDDATALKTSKGVLIGWYSQSDNIIRTVVCWDSIRDSKTQSFRLEPVGDRIDKNTTLIIKVNNFNYFNYVLKYNIEEKEVPGYVALEKLWRQILTLAVPIPLTEAALPLVDVTQLNFEQSLSYWYLQLKEADQTLRSELRKPTYTSNDYISWKEPAQGLSEIKVIKTFTEQIESTGSCNISSNPPIRGFKSCLNAWRDNTLDKWKNENATNGFQKLLLYEQIEKIHDTLIEKFDAFIVAANLVESGENKVVGKKKSGYIITVAIQSEDKNSRQEVPVSLEYFVHSDLPVTFHAGYAYSSIDDIEFEKVRSIADQDLFTRIKNSKDTDDFAAFLSYEIRNFGKDDEWAVMATLGTGFKNPTERIHFGGSGKYKRYVFGGGFTLGQETKPGNVVIDRIGTELETRELFDTFTKRRKIGYWFGLSISPF